MRTLLAVVVFLLLLPTSVLAQPASLDPQVTEDELRVSRREVNGGDRVSVEGEECQPSSQVSFELYAPHLISRASTEVQDQGGFAAQIRIPSNASPGRIWLRAICKSFLDPSKTRVLEATMVLARPPLVITLVNILFGVGLGLLAAGFGITMRRTARKNRKVRRDV